MEACTYCGECATTRDHVIPVSYNTVEKRLSRFGTDLGGTVPCCHECNSLLGNRFYHTVKDRRDYIHKTLSMRYQKLLKGAVWSPKELAEVGPELRSNILAAERAREVVRDRLRFSSSAGAEEALREPGAWTAPGSV